MKSKKIKQIIREELQQRIGQGTLKENGDTGKISLMGGNACLDAQGEVVPCPQGVDDSGEEQARIVKHQQRAPGERRTTSEIGHEGYEDPWWVWQESQARFNHMITEELGRLLNEGLWDDWTDLVVPDDRTSTNWLDLGSEVFNDAVSPYRDTLDALPTTRMMPNYGQPLQTIIVPDKPAGVQIPQSVESPSPEATIQPRHRTSPPPHTRGQGGPGQGDPKAGGYQGGPAGPPGRRDLYETLLNENPFADAWGAWSDMVTVDRMPNEQAAPTRADPVPHNPRAANIPGTMHYHDKQLMGLRREYEGHPDQLQTAYQDYGRKHNINVNPDAVGEEYRSWTPIQENRSRDLYETRFNQMIKEELGSLLNEFNVFTDLFGGNEKQGVPQPDTRADRITRTTGQPVMGQKASTHLANHYQQLRNAARAAAREKQNESRTPDLDESIQENWLYDTMDDWGLVYHGSEEQHVPQPQTASEKRAEKQAAQGVDSGNRDDMPSWVHDPAPAGGSKKVDVSINESKDSFSRMKELALKPYGSILKD